MIGFQRKYGVRYKSAAKQYLKEVKSKGCCLCGYCKCLDALEFHHVNGAEKVAALTDMKHLPAIVKELEKCILVCANCHREIHSGQIGGLYSPGVKVAVEDLQAVIDFSLDE